MNAIAQPLSLPALPTPTALAAIASTQQLAAAAQVCLTTIPVGNTPFRLAAAPNGNVYVANFGANTVSVIDSTTNTVIGSPIPVGVWPRGVAIANGRAYVANSNSDTVSVIDTATNSLVGSPIPLAGSPFGVAAAQNGHVFVTQQNLNTVSVIDSTTNTVIGSPIPVGSVPRGAAVAPNGRVYVTNSSLSANSVSVIDSTTNMVIATIPVGSGPADLAAAPNGRVYVANFAANSVSVIDSTTNMVIATIPVGNGPSGVAVAPSGLVYVTNGNSDTVSLIDSVTDTVIGSPIPVGDGPTGVTVAPNGSAYVADQNANTVSVLPGPPTLTGISPAQGSAAGGTQVTLTGTDLFGATVTIGGQPATNLFYNLDGTALIATTPPGTPGPATVTVTVTNEIGSASLPGGFTYVSAATTLSATPAVIRLNLATRQYYIPALSATLTDQVSGTPIPGQTITFTATPSTGPVTLGAAVTDANGTATLTNTPVSATLITASHYTATFAGSPGHPAATTTAPLTFNPV
ncbi:IPT/TIG domain-containing protein [Streptomyces shenzhenensis]|uniref:IPT/TIG domain-containing protein n=1 Tax=Streptomyces shenzhenensis TaxID=943815 RepID=UPI001F166DF8|nr:IPT/TIG domain-containing protein [Streptomyces shenzhenensis]